MEKLNKLLEDISSYVKTKQDGGYYGKGVQVVDLLKSTGDFEGFCRGSVIKYVSRWGRKSDKENGLDLFKAIHYIILLLLENTDEYNETDHRHIEEFQHNKFFNNN